MRKRACIIAVILNMLLSIVCGVNPGDQCVAFESSYHVDRACECVMYQSYGRSQGTFTSPNFPRIYPPNINCILYTFIGDLDEIVELSFLEFDLQASVSSKCSDFLRFFLDLERPEVNERHPWNYELCGNISTIVQKKHYSSTRSLILELHTDGLQANNSGFRGVFKFLDKANFEMLGGNKRYGPQCVYDFHSTAASKMGRFFSPRYPQNYPPSSRCTYNFYAMPGERVKVSFQNIQLEVSTAASDCARSPDVITVRDGAESGGGTLLARYCNTHNSEVVMSSGESLVVELTTDDRKQRQGFAASFNFVKEYVNNVPNSKSTTVSPLLLPPASDEGRPSHGVRDSIGDDKGPGIIHESPASSFPMSDCVFRFSSLTQRSGNFSSPNHPQPYFANVECRYIFEGHSRERIQLTFNTIDLYYPDGNPNDAKDCAEEVDSLTVNTYIDGHPHSIAIYCGHRRPDKLMSSDTRLDVIFIAQSLSYSATGFHASYKFITDYGMESGIQESDCSFRFKSESHPNGTFTSPNFPGIYPRNTECNYIFYGRHDERVYIKFAYFDVESVDPACADDTLSDYVEMSNFNLYMSDRKLGRMCGKDWQHRNDRTFMSDNNFFRVTFKSNNVYDATGFSAFYQFRSNDNGHNGAGKSPHAAGSSSNSGSSSTPVSLSQTLTLTLSMLALIWLWLFRTKHYTHQGIHNMS